MRIKDIPKENRPRERLKKQGISSLSDAELLAILLQNGYMGESVIDMSNRLIAEYGTGKLNSLSLKELMKIKGIGIAGACKILCAFELSKRVKAGSICDKKIESATDIADYYMEKMNDLKKEHFISVFLDSKNKIIDDETISVGILNASIIHPREIFKPAIKNSANSIILVHNHPSGDSTPSEEDRQITQKLMDAGELLNIKVLDHIIVGDGKHYSFTEGQFFS